MSFEITLLISLLVIGCPHFLISKFHWKFLLAIDVSNEFAFNFQCIKRIKTTLRINEETDDYKSLSIGKYLIHKNKPFLLFENNKIYSELNIFYREGIE